MKKLILNKDVVSRLSTESQVQGGAGSGIGSCQKGVCVTPKILTWFEHEEKNPGGSVGCHEMSNGEITCRDSGPYENPTMASCYYGCK